MCYSLLSYCVTDSIYKYFFMVDLRHASTVFHPNLPLPIDANEPPVILHIQYLENDANKAGIIDSMIRFDKNSPKIHPDSPGIPYT